MSSSSAARSTPAAAGTPAPLRVKGGSLRSKLAYVAEVHGAEAESALREELVERGLPVILEANWYPYEHFDRLLRSIAERHLDGDVSRLERVGRFSADRALTTTYDHYVRKRDLAGFLRRLSTLHGRFYDRGQLSVLEIAETSFRLRLHGAGFYREPDLYVAVGFFARAAELLGRPGASGHFEHRGESVEIVVAWLAAAVRGADVAR